LIGPDSPGINKFRDCEFRNSGIDGILSALLIRDCEFRNSGIDKMLYTLTN
jgi:hypothetical protein